MPTPPPKLVQKLFLLSPPDLERLEAVRAALDAADPGIPHTQVDAVRHALRLAARQARRKNPRNSTDAP
jgi:hypothetical protein